MGDDHNEAQAQEEAAPILSAEAHQKVRDKYVEWADKQIEQLTDRHTRSGEEFDKQIVALAGGGLALTITLAKDMLDKNTAQLVGVLLASWAGFIIALIVNLFSYRTAGKHYNLMIERMNHYRYSALIDKEVDTALETSLNTRITALLPRIEWLNIGALTSCLAGVGFFIIFITYNQYHHNGKEQLTSPRHQGATRPRNQEGDRSNLTASQSPAPASAASHDTSVTAAHRPKTVTNK